MPILGALFGSVRGYDSLDISEEKKIEAKEVEE